MFTQEELLEIDRDYFFVMNESGLHVMVKSNNTGHVWDIESQSLTMGKRSIVIHHKHKDEQAFHIQPNMHPHTITEAQEMIKKHDEWQLNQ